MSVADGKSDPDLLRIPPFRDAHMHFMVEGRSATVEGLQDIRYLYRKHGVFAVCDMGHRSGVGFAARDLSGGGFRVRTAGWALCRTGGYGGFIGKAVSGAGEIRRAVAELSDAGADFVKVINSGIVSARPDEPVTPGGFSPEELKIICQEAGEKGLQVACHANSDEAVKNAVLAGVSSVEHGFLISRETIFTMAEAGASWTPTVIGLRSILPSLNAGERRYVEEVLERHLIAIGEASAAGMDLRIGTDGGSRGVRHGESFIDELREFRKAGLSTEKILEAACLKAKDAEEGAFLIVRKDFIATGKIEALYEGGSLITF